MDKSLFSFYNHDSAICKPILKILLYCKDSKQLGYTLVLLVMDLGS